MNSSTEPQLIGSSGDSLREAFGKSLVDLANKYPKLVVLDADIAGGTGVHHFRKAFPERFFQFGIAEQNMMGAASGMAATGLLPVVTGFSVFLLRAYEQVRLSIGYTKRNVKIVASHPGLDVGPDGGSAQCLEDLAAFRAIPGMTVLSPADPLETYLMTDAILSHDGPVYMRTGRSNCPRFLKDDYEFEIGKSQIIKEGSEVAILACGVEVYRALQAAKILEDLNISCRVVNLSTIKPIDNEMIIRCSKEIGKIVIAEDHNIFGGLAGAVSEVLSQFAPCFCEFIGVKDEFGESGDPEDLAEKYQLSQNSIVEAAKRLII